MTQIIYTKSLAFINTNSAKLGTTESGCGKLSDGVEKAARSIWNEIDALKSDIAKKIDAHKTSTIDNCKKQSAGISEFLSSYSVRNIPLTNDVFLNTMRRTIAGRMPTKSSLLCQDALIVESLIFFFSQQDDTEPELLFCSENIHDFSADKRSDGIDRVLILHPLLQADLPPTRFFTDLDSLLEFARGYESFFHAPTTPLDDIVDMDDEWYGDIDDPKYWENFRAEDAARNRLLAEKFDTEIAPDFPDQITTTRNKIVRDIERILEDCRRCRSWGDGSELRLGEWLDFVPEEMIPYTSIPNLLRIRFNLMRFLHNHLEVDHESLDK